MLQFAEINLNPKHRRTGDCSTRALTAILNRPYQEVLQLQCEEASRKFYGLTDKQTIGSIAENFGFIKVKQPRKIDNKKYRVKELDLITTKKERKKGLLVSVANHWVAIKDDFYIDIWDSGDCAVGNYWKIGS